MMQANLEWFRTFKAIYETGTMSGAAKMLYVSQPGVGLHLNALEAYTGFPLFERTSRKMIPTERGILLYQQINSSLKGLEEIEIRFKKKAGAQRATLNVGMCVETFQQALEKHLPQLPFNLIMQFDSNEKLTAALEKGTIDLVLTSKRSSNKQLDFELFTMEKLVLVGGAKVNLDEFHQLNKQNKTELKTWLKSQLWYNTASDLRLLKLFWEQNFKELPDFLPNYIVPNKFSIMRCLAMGEGLAVLPDFICGEALDTNTIHKIWDGYTPIESPLYFGMRKNTILQSEVKIIKDLLFKEYETKETVL
ncbi:DNA-binding transcriptional regulator, LysR family [Pustulibacterium marinum]|uniref:DNA-binding transcriptional regulator, LysR family n=1 Tax=Pustulibacterium marinum TaxID=1224947 RepID=A0A1I7IMW6_9FLAO|nr:LysR family transcriptional regulator [Pustulibacterium marinum]SFU74263.1 DNA-binding transcriptional regulator, LysR family [Pustulibacterium marinum]